MFLSGFLLGLFTASIAFGLVVRYRARVFSFCRFVLSLSTEGESRTVVTQETSKAALDQTMYLEVVNALVGLGATKAQALRAASTALTQMKENGKDVSADALLMVAMMGVGK